METICLYLVLPVMLMYSNEAKYVNKGQPIWKQQLNTLRRGWCNLHNSHFREHGTRAEAEGRTSRYPRGEGRRTLKLLAKMLRLTKDSAAREVLLNSDTFFETTRIFIMSVGSPKWLQVKLQWTKNFIQFAVWSSLNTLYFYVTLKLRSVQFYHPVSYISCFTCSCTSCSHE